MPQLSTSTKKKEPSICLISLINKYTHDTYSFNLVFFHPIYKDIRSIFLIRTKKSINAFFTSKCHIRFVFQPLQSYKKEVEIEIRIAKGSLRWKFQIVHSQLYQKLQKGETLPGTKLASSVPAKQWGGYGGSRTSGSWVSRKAYTGHFFSQNILASRVDSSTILDICLSGTFGACPRVALY